MKKIIWSGFLVASALSAAYITPVLADEVNDNVVEQGIENVDEDNQETIGNTSDESPVNESNHNVQEDDNTGYEDVSNSPEQSSDQTTDGWQSDGRYYENGTYLVSQFKEINGSMYYFNESGYRIENQLLYLDTDSYSINMYYFNELGIMQTGWHTVYGNKMYFGSDGIALRDTWQDGLYLNSSGYAATDSVTYIDGKYYYFDAEGNKSTLTGWQTINGDMYYFQSDGTALTNSWKEGKYLGSDGIVVDNGYAGDYYLVNGEIQKNQLIGSYYYGSDGQCLKNEWKKINNKWMYFSEYGNCHSNGVYYVNDKYYAFDNDGNMITIAGWYDFYGTKYYIQNNGVALTNAWKDDSYLSGSGYAVANTTWHIGEKCYAFDSSAKLMKLSGWQIINGDKYYLNGDGTVLTNTWKDGYYLGYSGEIVTTGQAGDYYLINGEIQKNQLIDSFYYGSDGKCLKNQWKQIDGYWMYFDEYGYFCSGYKDGNGNVTIQVWNINDKFYGFDENGHMVKGLQESYENLYYFTSNGSALTNAWKDGRYFDYYGCALRDCVDYVSDDQKHYAFDKNGILIKSVGWKKIRNTWYYLDGDGTVASYCWRDGYYLNWDGSMGQNTWSNDGKYVGSDGKEVQPKWEKDENGWKLKYADGIYKTSGIGYISGKAYVFDDNGYMIYNQSSYASIYVDGNYKYGRVFAAQDGHLIKGWNKEYDNLYYYGDDYVAVENDLITIDNKKYYFEYNNLVCSRVFAYKGALYHSNANGEVTLINIDGQTGWKYFDNLKYSDKNEYSYYYYVENGVVIQNQFKIINGKKYYFYANGIMATGTFTVDDKSYLAADSGSIVENVKGWYHLKSNKVYSWYYFNSNSDLEVSKFLTFGNKTYYLDYDGRMQTGFFDVYGNYSDTYTYKKYYADNNGVIYNKKGWLNIGLSKYYQGDSLYLLTNEWLNNDNDKYYFDNQGILCVGVHRIYENNMSKVYYFDSDGILKDELDSFVGWKKFEGEWYYSDGENYDITGEVDGYFVYSGKRVTNGIFYTNDEKLYYLDGNGNKVYGLVSDQYGNKFYLDPTSGVGVTGWIKLNNQWYYFDNGNMCVGFVTINGKSNLFNENGVWIKECKPSSWVLENGKWYYLDSKGNAYFVYETQLKTTINGVTYYFVSPYYDIDLSGKYLNMRVIGPYMASNQVWYDSVKQKAYWVNADGKSIDNTDGWKTTKDGRKAYIENGEVVEYGIKNINGKNYFFRMGYLSSGLFNSDDKTYVFDDSYNEVTYKEGWNSLNGQWYFIKNGKALTSTWVGSYYLNGNGLTETGLVSEITYNNPQLLFNKGQLLKNNWLKVNGNYYYGDSNGYIVLNKWVGSNYLNNLGIMVTNAWVDNYWCGSDGKYVRSAWVDNGNYYVNEKGLKVTNAWVGNYWCGSDGKYVKSSWVDNNRYYVNDKGIYVAGTWKKDNIGWYYQAGDVYAKNITLNIDGVAYEFDNRGYCITK